MVLSLRYWSELSYLSIAVERCGDIHNLWNFINHYLGSTPASLLISKMCAHSIGLVIEYLAEVDTSVIPATLSNSNVESISIFVGTPTLGHSMSLGS